MAESKFDAVSYAGKAAAGGAVGFILAELVAGKINGMREKAGLPHVHHYHLGLTAVPPALINYSKPWSPYVAGFGGGLIINDAKDFFTQMKAAYAPDIKDRDLADFYLADELDAQTTGEGLEDEYDGEEGQVLIDEGQALPTPHIVQVPSYPRRAKYQGIANLIRGEVRNGAQNEYVRLVATEILKKHNIEGRDTPKVLAQFQKYFHNPAFTKYVYDQRLRDFERLQGAHITLPFHPNMNPKGMGSGDCDCMTIAYLAMAKAVGQPDVHAALIAQKHDGIYNHIMPVYLPKGKPMTWANAVPIELTRPMAFGQRLGNVKGVGFINMDNA